MVHPTVALVRWQLDGPNRLPTGSSQHARWLVTWTALLDRLSGTGRTVSRTERVLAVGRAFLTVTGLIAIYLDPTEPVRLREVTYTVLMSYAVYSLGVLVYVNRVDRITRGHTRALHGLDIAWTSVLTFVSEGPVSPFFLFFLFLLLAAAYRWGFRETAGTALVTVAVFLLETGLATVGPWRDTWFSSIPLELNRTILRVSYLMLTGVLLGYLAQQEKESRAETIAMALAAQQPNVRLGLGGSAVAVARLLRTTFGATSVVLVVRDGDTKRSVLWRVEGRGWESDSVQRSALTAEAEAAWLFPDEGRAWWIDRQSAPGGATAFVTEPDAWKLRRAPCEVPGPVRAATRSGSLSVVNLGLTDEWRARAYLVDASTHGSIERRLHFLEDLSDHLIPAMTNVFLIRRLRARAGAMERARVARELHDGAIQALFGIEMRLQAVRRNIQPLSPSTDAELADVQQMLRQEVLSLRELMQALRPTEFDSSEQLPDVLAALVERFRRDTGVSARFIADDGRVSMRASRALELVRIVQEALVNVRKHSGAANVLVRLATDGHTCALVIEDDGCGLSFEGRLTGAELDARRAGPTIIKERARLLNADLVIESTRGVGTRIEVRAPQDV